MRNKKFWPLFIVIAIYVAFISFPTYLFTTDAIIKYSVEVGLRSIYLIFIILFSIFTKIAKPYTGKTRYVNMLLLLPTFFVAFFYLFYWASVTKSSIPNPFDAVFNSNGNNTREILELVAIILMVVEEELLFRYLLQRNILMGHKIVRILITSAAFTICHFFFMLYRFNGIIIPLDLIELLFIFGIGFLLGFLYEYTNNIFVPMTFSMIFYICKRLINEVSFSTAPGIFYLTLSLVTLGTAAYLLIFYFVILKRENR